MLVPGRVTGFSSGPDAVENLRTIFEVEAEALEIIVPVGIVDYDLDLRGDSLGLFRILH